MSSTWRGEQRSRLDVYAVVRGFLALLLLVVVLCVVSVPVYVAFQVALTLIGVAP